MKLAVFGASGPTGRELVSQALAAGHALTALARDPARLGGADPRVRVVTGDATDPAAATAAVRGQDAVLCALGRGRSFRAEGLMTRAMRSLLPAMQREGVRRLVLMSSFGVSEPNGDVPVLMRLMFRVFLAEVFADKREAEALVRASDLDWTIVHPVLLTDGPRTGRYRAAERLELRGVPKISRADVAHFMLAELEGRRFARKPVVLSD